MLAVSEVRGKKTQRFFSFSPRQIGSQRCNGTEERLGAQREVEEGMERVYVDVVGQVRLLSGGTGSCTGGYWVGNGPEQNRLLSMPWRWVWPLGCLSFPLSLKEQRDLNLSQREGGAGWRVVQWVLLVQTLP